MTNEANWMLVDAAREGDNSGVLKALQQGAFIDCDNCNALHEAIHCNHYDTAKLLIQKGATVHYGHLAVAARTHYVPMLALMVEEGRYDIRQDNDLLYRSNASGIFNEQDEPMVAYMLEKGADSRAYECKKGTLNIPAILANHDLHDALEALVKTYANQGSTKSVRTLVYQAAAIAASVRIPTGRVAEFVEKSMKANLERGRTLLSPEEDFVNAKPLDKLARKIGMEGYIQAGNCKDMISEYVSTVLLPQLIIDSRQVREVQKPERFGYFDNKLSIMVSQLKPIAANILFGGKRLDEMLAMNAAWHPAPPHRAGNHIPDHLRPLRFSNWQPLINDITYHPREKDPLIFHALSSQRELMEESNVLHHCVGRSDYARKCVKGESHILSIRKDGKPIATVELGLKKDSKDRVHLKQIRGEYDRTPPQEATNAWNWFKTEVAEGRITLNKLEPVKKIKKSIALMPVIASIGYIPSQEKIDACLDHYSNHLLIKKPTWTRELSETSFAHPPRYKEGYSWVNTVSRKDVHDLIRETGMQDRWDETIRLLNPTASKSRPSNSRGSRPPAMAH